MKYLKTDLVGKCIRWKNGRTCIVMKVDDVNDRRISGNALICERVRCDMFNAYVQVCNKHPKLSLYIDGDSVDVAEIITQKVFNRICKAYLKTTLIDNELIGFITNYNG